MLETYFVKPQTVDGIRGSWIGGEIERYVGWLAEPWVPPSRRVATGPAARGLRRVRPPPVMRRWSTAAVNQGRLSDNLSGV